MKEPTQKPIKVLIFSASFIPSVVICVLRPLITLEKRGEVTLRVHPGNIKFHASKDIAWCDIAIFPRSVEYHDLMHLYHLKSLGKKIIYDIDDNFEEIPITLPIGRYHRTPHRLHVLKRFFTFSDVTRVYSESMKYCAATHNANVRVIKNCFDTNLIKNIEKKPKSNRIKIVYPSARPDPSEQEDFFYTALQKILIKYTNQIELHLWRPIRPKALEGLKQIYLHPNIDSYKAFIQFLYTNNYDIGLAPLLETPFFQSKTNTKYRELGGCEIAGIYSDVPLYEACVSQKKSGLLVKNTVDDWVDALSLLIENKWLREKIAKTAHEDITKNYTPEMTVDAYRTCLHDALNHPSVPIPFMQANKTTPFSCYVFPKAPSNQAFQIFSAALNYFRGHTPLAQTKDTFLATLTPEKPYHMVFFLVRNNHDFKTFLPLFSACPVIILNLLDYADDMAEIEAWLKSPATHQNQHWLTDDNQSELHALAEKHHILFASIAVEQNEPEIAYSLKSADAAYLDLIESNIKSNIKSTIVSQQIKSKKNIKQIIKSRIKSLWRYQNLCRYGIKYFWAEKQNLWIHLQWRRGKRI